MVDIVNQNAVLNPDATVAVSRPPTERTDAMFDDLARSARLAGHTLVALLLGGCAIATPFRFVTAPDAAAPDPSAPVVLVLTHAVADPDRRAAFDEHTRRVAAALPSQAGLIGYALRRELLGNEAWTMTVWRDEAARAAFVASPLHQAAIAAGLPGLVKVRFRRMSLPAGALPIGWSDALRLLDEDSRTYDLRPSAAAAR